ncbi:MAG: hypothetical protein AAB522_03320 [Patescibacteria group bacterium]
MPTLSIELPQKELQRAREVARKEGFKSPADWAKFLVARNIGFLESPKLKPSKIISEMKKTGLYKSNFLRNLQKSLIYADKALK